MKLNFNQLLKLKKALLKLSEAATEEGVTLITEDELAVGVEAFVDGDEGLVPASDGEYHYNGQTITVEGGVITNIAEQPLNEETPAEEEETPVEEQAAEEEEETPAEEEETPAEEEETPAEEEEKEDVEALKARIAELEALVNELQKKLAEPVAESVEEEMKRDEKNNKKQMDYSRLREAINKVKER